MQDLSQTDPPEALSHRTWVIAMFLMAVVIAFVLYVTFAP